jgi:AraC-like DNA-binding protein
MKLESTCPVAALRHQVRCFQQRQAHLDRSPVVFPIAARPDLILEFYLQERYLIRVCESGEQEFAPRVVVVGPCTFRRAELVLQGLFDVFTIHFQPSGFHQFFRAPMPDLADQAYDATSVIGAVATEIAERLAEASCFHERIQVATNFLLRYLQEGHAVDAVTATANRLMLGSGALRVDKAATSAAMSIRQFERRFIEQVGLPPKRYARIVRFDAALKAKMTAPRRPWTEIAHALGYHDQMHMVRDFQHFAGESPSAFVRRFLPESWA